MSVLVHPNLTLQEDHAYTSEQVLGNRRDFYRDLSSILFESGHLLAIDTTHALNWWYQEIIYFPAPVVIEHTLITGVSLPNQKRTVDDLFGRIKADITTLTTLP